MRGIVVWVRLANVVDAGATVVEKGEIERHLQKRAFGKIVPIASDLRQLAKGSARDIPCVRKVTR
jgi:hypothetical protein